MNTLGKMLTGLSLIAAGCAPPAYQAKQDYGLGHDSGVALYNIQQILADSCKGGSFADEQGFSCTEKMCKMYDTYRSRYFYNSGDSNCPEENIITNTIALNWMSIQSVESESQITRFHLKDGNKRGISTRNYQQAKNLEQAVRVLRMEMGAPLP